jgi:hypothetical protein
VISGEDGYSYHEVSTVWTRMTVIDGFTFGGDEAEQQQQQQQQQQGGALPAPSEQRAEGEGQDDVPPPAAQGEEEVDEAQESVVSGLVMARSPKRAQEETTTAGEGAENVKRVKTVHDGSDAEQESAAQATEQEGGDSPLSRTETNMATMRPKEAEDKEAEGAQVGAEDGAGDTGNTVSAEETA